MQRIQDCNVLKNVPVARDTYLMWLDVGAGKEKLYWPGRFVHLQVPGRPDLILRRPISIHGYHNAQGRLELVYQLKGAGTHAFAACKPGDVLSVLGPLGNGFSVPEGARECVLLGGGIGCAPLKLLPQQETEVAFDAILGFRSSEWIYQREEFERVCRHVQWMTDDGSFGEQGFVTSALQRRLESGARTDAIFVCGPAPMYRSLYAVMERFPHVPCYVSLEERMGCGMGACMTCTCEILRQGEVSRQRVCLDGPVFDWKEIVR